MVPQESLLYGSIGEYCYGSSEDTLPSEALLRKTNLRSFLCQEGMSIETFSPGIPREPSGIPGEPSGIPRDLQGMVAKEIE